MKAVTKGGRPGTQLGRGSRTLSAASQPALLPPGVFLNITYHNRETLSKSSNIRIYFTTANEWRVQKMRLKRRREKGGIEKKGWKEEELACSPGLSHIPAAGQQQTENKSTGHRVQHLYGFLPAGKLSAHSLCVPRIHY